MTDVNAEKALAEKPKEWLIQRLEELRLKCNKHEETMAEMQRHWAAKAKQCQELEVKLAVQREPRIVSEADKNFGRAIRHIRQAKAALFDAQTLGYDFTTVQRIQAGLDTATVGFWDYDGTEEDTHD